MAEEQEAGAAKASNVDINAMPVIERRRIEAMVLGPMLRAFQAEFGEDKVKSIARRVISQVAREQGRQFAERTGKQDLKSFASNKGAWRMNGALETDVLEESETRYSFNVTRCKYAEMYHELGFGDLGEVFSCTRDFEFSKGYNPAVKLARTQTIMQGATHCDFRYELRPAGKTRSQSKTR